MWNAEQRRRALGEHLQRLAVAVGQVQGQAEQLTEGQLALLSDMEAVLRALPGAIDRTWQDFEAVADEAERERSRRDLCATFEEVVQNLIHEIVPVLVESSSSLVPVELEPVLQEQLREARPSRNYKPILYAAPELNYSVFPLPTAAEILEGVGAATEQQANNYQLLALSTPSIARDSIALHAILLGHELGHVSEWETDVAAGFQPAIPDAWKDADGNLDIQHSDAFSSYVELVSIWGEELVADIFSTLLLGPVALMALPELMGAAAEMTTDNDTHPGTDRRIRLMAELLQEMGFNRVDVLGSAIDQYFDQYKDAWDREINLEDGHAQESANQAWTALRGQISEFKRQCAEHVAARRITPDVWPDVLRARGLLRLGLPCSEIWHEEAYRSTDLPVILNAAWLVKVHDLADLAGVVGMTLGNTESLGEVSQVLDRLVAKSIEISNRLRLHS